MLWLMVNKEWQLEFKILSLLLIKLISKTQLRNVSTAGFPILNPVCPPELAPYKPPHEANPEYFPRWSCKKSVAGVVFANKRKEKERTELHTPFFLPNSSVM